MSDYLPVSDQLNLLFEAVLHADGRPYTLQEVSAATGISPGTLSQLRNGQSTNPQLNTLRALGHFFRVPLALLRDPLARRMLRPAPGHPTAARFLGERDRLPRQRPVAQVPARHPDHRQMGAGCRAAALSRERPPTAARSGR